MCQIFNIEEMGFRDPRIKIKEKFKIVVRMIGILFLIQEIKQYKTKKTIPKIITNKQNMINSSIEEFNVGDIVKIRSKEEILQTLNEDNKLEGCFFMDEMWQYCGSQHKVLKKVNHFFDERGAKLYKTRNIVLLEGVYCSGKQGILMPSCDRNCLIFWKEKWLKKIK